MGSFEARRDEFLRLLGDRNIECVLTGHSHRRGLYVLGDRIREPGNRRPPRDITLYDPEQMAWPGAGAVGRAGTLFRWQDIPESHRKPAIVVSDSGGPYPRYNRYGEFGGWGSDKPSGSVVGFNEEGRLDSIEVVRARAADKPRLAVAVDYFDVLEGGAWAHGLSTGGCLTSAEGQMLRRTMGADETFYALNVELHERLAAAKLRVKSIALYDSGAVAPLSLEAHGRNVIELRGATNHEFHRWIYEGRDPRFVSVVLEFFGNRGVAGNYDTNMAWNYEVVVEFLSFARAHGKRYLLRRPLRRVGGARWFPEAPDFNWRRAHGGGD